MSETTPPPKVTELVGDAYTTTADAVAAANHRLLAYWKTLWDITTRPYASSGVDAAVRENFDRASEILTLTVDELKAQEKQLQDLTEKALSHGEKLQDATITAFRGVLDKSIANLKHVQESTSARVEELKKQINKVPDAASRSAK